MFPLTGCGLFLSVCGPLVCNLAPSHPGVIAPILHLIVSDLFLPLLVWLLIGCPGETSLLCLPAQPSPLHLLDQQDLLHLPASFGLSRLPVQSGLLYLPITGLPASFGILDYRRTAVQPWSSDGAMQLLSSGRWDGPCKSSSPATTRHSWSASGCGCHMPLLEVWDGLA